jgi:hypothetical protein
MVMKNGFHNNTELFDQLCEEQFLMQLIMYAFEYIFSF